MRRVVWALLALLTAACGGGEDAGDQGREVSSSPPATEDPFIRLTGWLSTPFVVTADCAKAARVLEGGVTTDTAEAFADAIEAGFARAALEDVQGQAIEFRDASGSVIGEAITDRPAKARFVEPSGKYQRCLAMARYAIELPRIESYVIRVPDAEGAPEPVTLDALEARDLTCNLHIHTDGKVLQGQPCDGGGWVDFVMEST